MVLLYFSYKHSYSLLPKYAIVSSPRSRYLNLDLVYVALDLRSSLGIDTNFPLDTGFLD
jgi:hypothetical protein